jgi:hypothetical protein
MSLLTIQMVSPLEANLRIWKFIISSSLSERFSSAAITHNPTPDAMLKKPHKCTIADAIQSVKRKAT